MYPYIRYFDTGVSTHRPGFYNRYVPYDVDRTSEEKSEGVKKDYFWQNKLRQLGPLSPMNTPPPLSPRTPITPLDFAEKLLNDPAPATGNLMNVWAREVILIFKKLQIYINLMQHLFIY